MAEVQIYKPQYRKEVIDLVISIQQGEFNVPITVDDQPDLKDVPAFYQKGNGNFWVAVDDGKVVGTVGLIDIGNQESALRKMFVYDGFRGKPHETGSKLLQELFSWTVSKKINTIYLGTRTNFYAAHRFYEKNGFTELPVDELPSNFPRMPLDNKFYKYQSTLR